MTSRRRRRRLSSAGIAGTLGLGDTTDYFSYTAPSAGLLSARLSGLSANLDVVVYDFAGKARAKSQRASTADESASTLVTAGETLLVRVTGADGAFSNYALDVDVDPLPAGEPDNNTQATAQTLDMSSSTFQASVGATWGDKTDFYKFVAPSSGVLTAGLSGMSGDLNLVFYDAAGKAIRPPKTTGTADESVTALVVVGQTYGIQVQPTKGVVSDYTLTVPIAALPAGEPDNNALATAPTIDPSVTINASVGATWGDKTDYYNFTAPITGLLSASMTGMSGDLTLNLLNASGARLKKSANAGTADEAISHLVTAGETYVVQVQPSKGVVSDYTLNLPIAALPSGEPENNLAATAPTIASIGTTTGNVGAAWGDKVDYFKFTAASTGRLTAHLGGMSGDLDVLVTNAAGKAVARGQALGTIDEAASGLVTAGEDYTIRVTPKKGITSDYVLQTEIDSGVFL